MTTTDIEQGKQLMIADFDVGIEEVHAWRSVLTAAGGCASIQELARDHVGVECDDYLLGHAEACLIQPAPRTSLAFAGPSAFDRDANGNRRWKIFELMSDADCSATADFLCEQGRLAAEAANRLFGEVERRGMQSGATGVIDLQQFRDRV